MKRIVCVVVIAYSIMFIPAFSVHAHYPRFARVDVQKVILKSDKGIEASKEFTDEINEVKKDLQKRKLSSNAQEYMQLLKNYQTKLNDKRKQLTETMLHEVRDTIKSIAAKDKYTLIVESSGVYHIDPSIKLTDITEEVLVRYNEAKRQPNMSEAETDIQNTRPDEKANYDQYVHAFAAPNGKTMHEWALTRIAASGNRVVPGCIVEIKDNARGLIVETSYSAPRAYSLDYMTGSMSPVGPQEGVPGGSIKISYTSKDLHYEYNGFDNEKTTWERIVRDSPDDRGTTSIKAVKKNGIYYLKSK